MSKIVHVPRFLHDIHGENPTRSGLWATYLAGAIFGVFGVVAAYGMGLEWWQVGLVGILFFDIGGGVVANFTSSTNQYYQKSAQRRVIFLALHVLQPLILVALLGKYWEFGVFLAAYTVAMSLIINDLRRPETQMVFAGVFVVLGVTLLTFFTVVPLAVFAFGVLFMVKLLVGFSVRRPRL